MIGISECRLQRSPMTQHSGLINIQTGSQNTLKGLGTRLQPRPRQWICAETAGSKATTSPRAPTSSSQERGGLLNQARPAYHSTPASAGSSTQETVPLPASTSESTCVRSAETACMASSPVCPSVSVRLAATSTPLSAAAFRRLLQHHPDGDLVRFITETITHGASIAFNGPRHNRFTKNSRSACIHANVLRNSIAEEVERGHARGPFDSKPFQNFTVSSLGVRPKKDGGHRIILDLSQPCGDSINDYIDASQMPLEYCSVDDAIRMLTDSGVGALMGKIDIKSAYRLIPVREQDWPLLGYQIDGKFYHDVVLPFGCRSSPFLFSRFADAIHWIVGNKTGRDAYLHYVDDFFFVGTAGSK